MNNNMQGGNMNAERKFFESIMKYLPSSATKYLDLGSGIGFALEKKLYKYKGVSVTCLDRLDAGNVKVPSYVNYI